MTSFLGIKAKETMNLSDEIIAKNILASATGMANAYLNALMQSTTPEVRASYAASLNQIIDGHSTLTELIVNREWGNPYLPAKEQLSNVFSKVQSTIQKNQE